MVTKLIAEAHKHQLTIKTIEKIELTHHRNEIYVPTTLIKAIVEWYHKILEHLLGTSRSEKNFETNIMVVFE